MTSDSASGPTAPAPAGRPGLFSPGSPGSAFAPNRADRGAHTVHRLRYHALWIPRRLEQIFHGATAEQGWALHALAVREDHVHAFVQAGPRTAVSELMQRLKGTTGSILRREFPDLQRVVRADALWAPGYYVATVGTVEESRVREYIRRQQ